MLNQAQREYIESIRASHPDIDIEVLRQTLAGAQWTESHILEGIARYEGKFTEAPTPIATPDPKITNPLPETAAHIASIAPTLTTDTPQALPSEPGVITIRSPRMPTPTTPASAPTQPKHTLRYAMIAGGIILFLGATGAGAYYVATKTSLFAPKPLTNETLLTSLVEKMTQVNTAHYAFETSVSVNERKPGLSSFSAEQNLKPEELATYLRDQDRMRDIEQIQGTLSSYYYKQQRSKKPQYPWSLKDASVKATDPQGKQYVYTRTVDGTGYALTVTFETEEAVRALLGEIKYKEYRKKQTTGTTVTIKSGEYFSTRSFSGKPRRLSPFGYTDISPVEALIPANMQGKFALSGIIDNSLATQLDTQIGITSEATFGDMTFAFDVEAIKKKDTYYAIIKKMPAFLSSISNLRGKWIVFKPEDINDSLPSRELQGIFSGANEGSQAARELYRKQFSTLLKIAQDEHLIVISGTPEHVTLGDQKLTKYQLAFTQEKILPFYERAVKELETYKEKSILPRDEDVVAYLTDKDFPMVFNYMKNAMTLSVWTDKKGYPTKTELTLRYIPQATSGALKDRELDLTLAISLSDINELITIAEPKETVAFSDLVTEMTGKTRAQLRIERQEGNIRQIRNSLNAYMAVAGQYPASLTDLLKKRSEVVPLTKCTPASTAGVGSSKGLTTSTAECALNDHLQQATGENPFMSEIPMDTYTNKPFTYSTTGKDYALAYQITLDPYTPEKNPGAYYERDYQTASLKASAKKPAPKVRLFIKYVDGINTANANKISQEAYDTSLLDTDNDGLPDILETLFGTDSSKKDTDGDGYTDAEEIFSSNNPLGPGTLNIKKGTL